ncbi:restriction endonuclease subunit S [Salinibacter ruber]|uniref:Type I restriction enzyme S subunit n=1 Tax=Salinibacter ruber TaxID=146919 RepID=A0AAW5P281_9BACT|nr:restriction endonuclease subunit S [Salinibacter ruber]MCS4156101.1 type I restriction enzyme S subunit [Salinibacter ruber]
MSDDLDFEMEVVEDDELGSTASPSEGSIKPDDAANDDRSSTELVESKEEASSRFEGLPDAWAVHKLQEAAKVVGGSTPSTNNDEYWGGDMPWATPTDVTGLRGTTITETEDKITEEGLNSASTHILPEYSVLMTSRATIGACAVNTVPMATNQGFQSLVPGERLNTWYLFYRMLNEAPYLESLGAGSTFSEVSKRVVEKVDIPVPPLPEQRKIASVLYAVDQAIQKTEAIIEQAKRVKRGLVQDLLSSGVDSTGTIRDGSEDFKQSPCGAIPLAWEAVSLGEVAEVQGGYAFRSGDFTEKGVPVVRMSDLQEGRLDLADARRVPDTIAQSKQDYALQVGDVLVGMSGSIEKYAVVQEEDIPCMLNQRVGRFITDSDTLLEDFLKYLVNTKNYQDQVDRMAAGAAQRNVSASQIEQVKIPLPPVPEQRRIANVLASIDKEIRGGISLSEDLKQLKHGLMQDLLTGEVRTMDKTIEVLGEVKAHG